MPVSTDYRKMVLCLVMYIYTVKVNIRIDTYTI